MENIQSKSNDSSIALPRTLSAHLAKHLRHRIITGKLLPGQALREQDIEREFGSSRGPVRESLRLLLQSGLVEYAERRGFRVRTYTVTDVGDIYDLRANLEGLVIACLTGKPLSKMVADLDASNIRMATCFTANEVERYFVENQVFHDRIIAETGNRPITEIMVYINEVSLPIRYRVLLDALPTRRSLSYHERILDFLKKGDLLSARQETEEHILVNKAAAIELYQT